MKKVFVSGCFDMLHSGHVAFLQEAAKFGELYVGIGADETVRGLKGRYPINTEKERKYMIDALKCVKKCLINSGDGLLDFVGELETVKPQVFVVNEDGNSPVKSRLMKDRGIEYVVLSRVPHANLPVRSTTSLRSACTMPYRIDLAGGWLDQPFVSKFYPGPVLTISLEPTIEFYERGGMASSTRRKAIELWQTDVPDGDREKLAKMLFSFENPPGTDIIAGSQDALGIVMPGLNKLDYAGEYWPESIESVHDESVLTFLENRLYLVPLSPRENGYDVLANTTIDEARAKNLADAANHCWDAILKKDVEAFGHSFYQSFQGQIGMFPNMVDDHILGIMETYRDRAYGWKLSGAGGGGYMIFVADTEIEGSIRIKIRRKSGL